MSHSCSSLLGSSEAVNRIRSWVYHAGQIALRYFNNVDPQSKADQTFVTQADLEIELFLSERLRAAYPAHAIIGEEGTWNEIDQPSPSLWAIDPIDGTTAFVQGLPGWGISLGLLHQGQPCFGIFYMPLLDDMSYTTAQGEVYSQGRRLEHSVRQDWGAKGFLAINATAHHNFQINVRRTRAMGSISASLIYTARGAAVGTFIPRAHIWDLVAGAAILMGVGGELRDVSGRLVDYSELLDGRLAPEPIIAAHPDLQAELRNAIGSH